jgi:hypothetical protein
VDVLEAREPFDRGRESLGKGLGGVFDLSRVESSNTADLEASSNLCGKTSLAAELLAPRTLTCPWSRKIVRSGENNVQELLAGGNHGNVLPLRLHFGGG